MENHRPFRAFRLATLGCKVNQYDSQQLREQLAGAGLSESGGADCDLVVVNTCAVTNRAAEKARRAIRKLARAHPGARLVLTGCLADHRPEALAALLEGINGKNGGNGKNLVVPNAGKADLARRLGLGRPASPAGVSGFAGRSRALLKVQDGCDGRCAYCVVPRVRGPSRSRELGELLAEAGRLAAAGFRELVVTGCQVGDWSGPGGLAGLLARLAALPGVGRLRLSSLEPGALLAEGGGLAARLAAVGKLCPHFALPLQSGSAKVLERMNRPYGPDEYLAAAGKLKKAFDRPGLTTDVIVGFPGETADDFERTLAVLAAAGCHRVHAFPFSPVAGTPAADWPGRPPPAAVRERMARLKERAAANLGAFRRSFVGEEVEVLVEEKLDPETGLPAGFCPRYLRVQVPGGEDRLNQIVPVRLAEENGRLKGTIADAKARRQGGGVSPKPDSMPAVQDGITSEAACSRRE